jgi:quercetin dioxygenase-like cupin family protein
MKKWVEKSTQDYPKFVPKGWGHELWLVNNQQYCGKLLYFVKGKACSFHYHNIKDETFYLESGQLLLYYQWSDCLISKGVLDFDQMCSIVLEPGDVYHIPPQMRHMMAALEESRLFEFSTHHEEEDSIRVVKGD